MSLWHSFLLWTSPQFQPVPVYIVEFTVPPGEEELPDLRVVYPVHGQDAI